MAFYPAYCDNNCKGCEKNFCGWCIWKDMATAEYKTESFKVENAHNENNGRIHDLLHGRADKEGT